MVGLLGKTPKAVENKVSLNIIKPGKSSALRIGTGD